MKGVTNIPEITLNDNIGHNTLPWHRIFIRSGFNVKKDDLSFPEETEDNLSYLKYLLDQGKFGVLDGRSFIPDEPEIDQGRWLSTVEKHHYGAEGGQPDCLEIMDTYMAGVIRWISHVELKTTYSCQGHHEYNIHGIGERQQRSLPTIEFVDPKQARIGIYILNWYTPEWRWPIKDKKWICILQTSKTENQRNNEKIETYLLDLAEWLYNNRQSLSELVRNLKVIPYVQ